MNCIPILEGKKYDLKGYSPDTYMKLAENDLKDPDECVSWLAYLEMTYG
jgi:pyruvate-formate lyase-activating enzyme